MFRRTPSAPNPHAALLTDEGVSADTEVFEAVAARPADTLAFPAVDEGPSVTTGPATVVYNALEVARDAPAEAAPPPARRAPRRPRTARTWTRFLAEVCRDPMSALYIVIIAVAAAATGWGTMVVFRPQWVPPAINPKPVHHPVVHPADHRPPDVEPATPPQPSQRPQDGPRKAEPTPTRTKRPKAAQKPTRAPQEPVPPFSSAPVPTRSASPPQEETDPSSPGPPSSPQDEEDPSPTPPSPTGNGGTAPSPKDDSTQDPSSPPT